MKKVDNFCTALANLKDIYEQTRELFYPMFVKLKEEIEANWRV